MIKCYYPYTANGEKIGFKTPEGAVYDQNGVSLTTKLANLEKASNGSNGGTSYSQAQLDSALQSVRKTIANHTANTDNPHNVTKDQVGLGAVKNLDQSKAIKSIEGSGTTFTCIALDGTKTTFTAGSSASSYTHPTYTPHTSGLYKITVDTTGHVSAATAVTKSDITALGIPAQDTNTTYSEATTTTAGLMSTAMVSKLNSIATGANVYTHPSHTAYKSGLYKITVDASGHVTAATAVSKADITALGIPGQDTNTTYSNMKAATASTDGGSGLVPAPARGDANRFLRSDGTWAVPVSSSSGTVVAYTHPIYPEHASGLYKITVDTTGHVSAATAVTKSDITALGIPGQDTNTTYSNMKAATTSAAGASGLVPAPTAGAANRYLRSDGTWATPPDTNTTYNDATTSTHGLMTAAMVTKLNGIAAGAQVNAVTSVAGRTGAITLAKADVGLGNVDNTADSAKSVKYATSAGSANAVAWANVNGKPELAYVSGASDLPSSYTGGDVWKAPS